MADVYSHIGWSSHVYPLEVADLRRVRVVTPPPELEAILPPDPIVLAIRGRADDLLLRGRELVEAAATGTLAVRIAFLPTIPKWNLPALFLRVIRQKYLYMSSGTYHMTAEAIRRMGLERAIRSVDHPQPRPGEDRPAQMRALMESLRRDGYDDAQPICIWLCRSFGCMDSLRQGHHRVSACLASGVSRVAVRFMAAGALPRELRLWKRKDEVAR